MNPQRMRLQGAFISHLFNELYKYKQQFLHQIHKQQQSLKNTPNFTYKGKVYILVDSSPIKRLDRSLDSSINEYLVLSDDIDNKTIFINEYYATNIQKGLLYEFILAFPLDSLKAFFTNKDFKDVKEPNERPKNFEKIVEVLNYLKVFNSL